MTPLMLSFDFDTPAWDLSNTIVDLLFFTDMIFVFNTAIETEEFEIIDDHKNIAIEYISGWFAIDLLAIIPFGWFIPSGGDDATSAADFNQMVRVMRIGRLTKLVKLLKLLRILKFAKKSKAKDRQQKEFLQLTNAFNRLFFFCLIVFLITHLITCMFIFQATFVESDDDIITWLSYPGSEYRGQTGMQLYLSSLFWTTIISYGNYFAFNAVERLFGLFIMLLGGLFMTYSISIVSSMM
jgi:hypothetical protein